MRADAHTHAPGRHSLARFRAVLSVVLTLGAGTAVAAPPTFTGLGFLPGGQRSTAFAVSANGAYIVGFSATPLGDRAFRWNRFSGMQSLGVLPGDMESRAVAVSADGKAVVGFSRASEGYHAFRWTSAGMIDLGTLPGGSSCVVTDISDDGTIAVGYCDVPDGFGGSTVHAFKRTIPGAMIDLGTLPGGFRSYATSISGDGSVIVGSADGGASFGLRAVRLMDASPLEVLGAFPGTGGFTVANAVSVDGSTIVGEGSLQPGYGAFRWTGNEGIVDIGSLPDAVITRAHAVSGDGRIAVGNSESPFGEAAILWTAERGVLDLNTYLTARGLDLSGWVLIGAYAISADGLTIAGVGDHNGVEEAWVAFLGSGHDLSAIEQLGKSIASDPNLSSPAGQACFTCHSGPAGFANPQSSVNAHGAVHRGAVAGRFGNRKPPSLAYAGFSPVLHLDEEGTWIGGLFFDGHAPGWTFSDPLAEQALFPFLNPVEQNNPDASAVVNKVAGASYAPLFRDVWGEDALDPEADPAVAYERIVRSIAAYERSREVNPFNSKYDEYLAGRTLLNAQELRGLTLFNGVAGCSACHPSEPGPNGEPPLFTDFTYDNIGTPANPENPFYTMPYEINPDGEEFVDLGLGGFLASQGFPQAVFGPNIGKQKVPTLRNVDRRPEPGFVRAYGHNGVFKSLEEVVHFYNTRDVEEWPPPEVPQNVNITELGNLHLTPDDEAAIVAFMKTLTDRDATPISCPADFNSDSFVSGDDFDAYTEAFVVGAATADTDRDGFVTGADFDLFVLAFIEGC